MVNASVILNKLLSFVVTNWTNEKMKPRLLGLLQQPRQLSAKKQKIYNAKISFNQ